MRPICLLDSQFVRKSRYNQKSHQVLQTKTKLACEVSTFFLFRSELQGQDQKLAGLDLWELFQLQSAFAHIVAFDLRLDNKQNFSASED